MPGFNIDSSGATSQNIVYADNVDFSGSAAPTPKVTTNGQLLIGSTAAPNILVGSLTSPMGTVTIGYSSPNITLDVTGLSNAIEKINVDTTTGAGTNPVLPTGGVITMTGGIYATGTFGTRVVTINSAAANSLTVDVQISSAVASTNMNKNGVSHFDNTLFTVDANGFVSATTTGFVKTLTGNSGGAIAPVANNINTVGTGSITIAGAGSTLTTQLTGLTNHAVQVGAGTATLTQVGPTANTGAVLQNNNGADPSYSTATYPSTTTINQILYSSAANTVTGLATANRAVLTTTSAGVPVVTALATDGQLIIGSTAGAPAAATLTAGAGISITNASNSITIAASGAGLTWSVKSASFNAAISNGYFITGNATATLPASPSIGDTIAFFVQGAFTVTITGNTGQAIQIASNLSSAAGTQANTATGDSCTLVYDSTNTQWNAVSFVGAWNKT
jgi:trimeric autotransporter adhesin